MKQTRRRTASLTTLLAFLLSGVVPIAAFAVEEPIGPTGSFEAPANANETTVCEALGEVLGLGSLEQAKRVNWPPEETTASTDELDGFPYLVLKSGQVYEYFSFPAGYDRELLANGAETSFAISNITGCAFEEVPVSELELVKVWDVPEDLDVDLSGVASLTVDGAAVDAPVVVDAGATYTLGESVDEEALAAVLPEACAWVEGATSATLDGEAFEFPGDLLVPTDVTEDTTYVLEVTNVVTCEEPEEPVLELELVKVWDVPEDLDVDLSGVASLTVDGAAVDAPVVVDAGATYTLGESVDEEALAAVLPEACAWVEGATSATLDGEAFEFAGDLLVPTDVTEDTIYVLEVTNVIDCADVAEVVIERGPDPEPEPEVTPTVEVLDVTQTAVALPETGAPAILLALLGLVSMMLGGGMLTTRRRE